MPKKLYTHIKLPTQLISQEGAYTPPRRRPPIVEKPPFDQERNRRILARKMGRVNRFYSDRAGENLLVDDRGNRELRIKFRGPYSPKLIKKYGVDIYRITPAQGDKEIVYGKISDVKVGKQKLSNFERFKKDITTYENTGKLKTHFDGIEDFRPLEIKEVVEPTLYKDLQTHTGSEYNIDISFAGTNPDEKLNAMAERFGNRLIAKVSTEQLHYCRVKTNFEGVQAVVNDFRGISLIEHSPVYMIETSRVHTNVNNVNVMAPPQGLTPAFVFDSDVNQNHFSLHDVVQDKLHNDDTDFSHGTAVASLVVCGSNINTGGILQQNNRVISVKVTADNFAKIDQIIKETIETYADRFPIIIANLSINQNCVIYARNKTVDKFTILLDELAEKHGCLFVVSAGNSFQPYWPQTLATKCQQAGYPNFFKEKCTRILPPADSINNISVGSIAFQESADSMAKIKSPVLHTRGNLDNFPFIKPDLVHYDSNYRTDYSCEENGVLMAGDGNDTLTSMPGTSFAAPQVTHDLALLHNKYPTLNANSLKGLLLHFADKTGIGTGIQSKKIREKLIGFGMPNIGTALYSNNHRSTVVIEDDILAGKEKTIRFPVPASLAGNHDRRVRIRKTLVYNPKINAKNPRLYNPLNISVQLVRPDDRPMDSFSTRSLYDGASSKSNVKSYPATEKSTREHTGAFWYLKVFCENKDPSFVPDNYRQIYSIILSVEDIKEIEGVDVHEDILNMIQIETHVAVPIEIET